MVLYISTNEENGCPNLIYNVPLIKTTAALNEVALSYHRVRGLYFLTVAFAATII